MVDKLKNAWKSWTIWFNGVVLAALPFTDNLKDLLPQLADYIDSTLFKQVMGAVVAINIALRLKTTKDLADK